MNFLENSEFVKARESGHFFDFGKIDFPEFKWEDTVFLIDESVQNKLLMKITENYGLVVHNGDSLPMVKNICRYISKLNESVPCTAHIYISFSSLSKTFGRHRDTSEVFFWQGIGSTKWIIDDLDGVKETILKKNHLIYIPKGMFHDVIPLSPRVGISMGLDY